MKGVSGKALAVLFAAAFLSTAAVSSADEALYAPGEVIVKFKTPAAAADVRASLHGSLGAVMKKRLERFGADVVKLPKGMGVEQGVSVYRRDPAVEYAEPNYRIKKTVLPDDTYFNRQWGLDKMDAQGAWDTHTGDGSIVVAVIDTGIDDGHEDFMNSPDTVSNIWSNPGETNCNNNSDDDKNGYVDDCGGWNFVNGNNDPFDDDGHGTHISGIIGAFGNNSMGISGVNWGVRVMPLKILDKDGGGTIADALQAVQYAIDMGANIINASYGYPSDPFNPCARVIPSQLERDAVKAAGDAGILFAAAAGNDGCDNDANPFYPASHALPNIISVAASDNNDFIASFSNTGKDSVDAAAPGVSIWSTVPQGFFSLLNSKLCKDEDGDTKIECYDEMSGTSMAAPHAAGLAALLTSYSKAAGPGYTNLTIKETILASVDVLFPDDILSGGRINAFKAITLDINTVPPSPPTNLEAIATSAPEPAVDLYWVDNSTVEDGYVVERKEGVSGTYAPSASLPPDTVTYRDTTVAAGTLYFYRVKAVNGIGDSPYSSATSPLYSPTGLTAVPLSLVSVRLTWKNNSLSARSIGIERRSGIGGGYALIGVLAPEETSFIDDGISPSTTYFYRVFAYTPGFNLRRNSAEAVVTTSSADGGDGGACFIATAAYGGYTAEYVKILRDFRDGYLLTNAPGRAFVEIYYKYSPPLADYIAEHKTAKAAARALLTPVVLTIKYPFAAGFIVVMGILAVTRKRNAESVSDTKK